MIWTRLCRVIATFVAFERWGPDFPPKNMSGPNVFTRMANRETRIVDAGGSVRGWEASEGSSDMSVPGETAMSLCP